MILMVILPALIQPSWLPMAQGGARYEVLTGQREPMPRARLTPFTADKVVLPSWRPRVWVIDNARYSDPVAHVSASRARSTSNYVVVDRHRDDVILVAPPGESVQAYSYEVFKYGVVEVRFKFKAVPHLRYSFSLRTPDEKLEDGIDIIVIDVVDNGIIRAWSAILRSGEEIWRSRDCDPSRLTPEVYHVVGLDWDDDRLDIYIDGYRLPLKEGRGCLGDFREAVKAVSQMREMRLYVRACKRGRGSSLGAGELRIDWVHMASRGVVDPVIDIPGGKVLLVPYFHQGTTGWCWANSLSMILQYYGRGVHAWDIAKALNMGWDEGPLTRWAASKLEDLLEDWGYSADSKKFKPDEFEPDELWSTIKSHIDRGEPVWLVMIEEGHAVVVVGYKTDEEGRRLLIVHDPSGALDISVGFEGGLLTEEAYVTELARYYCFMYSLVSLNRLANKEFSILWITGKKPEPPKATLNIVPPVKLKNLTSPAFYNPSRRAKTGNPLPNYLMVNNMLVWWRVAVLQRNAPLLLRLALTNAYFESVDDVKNRIFDTFVVEVEISSETLGTWWSKAEFYTVRRVGATVIEIITPPIPENSFIRINLYDEAMEEIYDSMSFSIIVYDRVYYRRYGEVTYLRFSVRAEVTYGINYGGERTTVDAYINLQIKRPFGGWSENGYFLLGLPVIRMWIRPEGSWFGRIFSLATTDVDGDRWEGDPGDKGGGFPVIHGYVDGSVQRFDVKIYCGFRTIAQETFSINEPLEEQVFIVDVEAFYQPISGGGIWVEGVVKIINTATQGFQAWLVITARNGHQYEVFASRVSLELGWNELTFEKAVGHQEDVVYVELVIELIEPRTGAYISQVTKNLYMLTEEDIEIVEVDGLKETYPRAARLELLATVKETISEPLPDEALHFYAVFSRTSGESYEVPLYNIRVGGESGYEEGLIWYMTYKLIGLVSVPKGEYDVKLVVEVGQTRVEKPLGRIRVIGEAGHMNLVYLIDRSGSMGSKYEGKKKLAWAQEAVEYCISRMRDGDYAGVVSFSSSATVEHDIVPIDDDTRESLKDAVYSLYPSGFTNIGEGLLRAMELLNEPEVKSNGLPRVIVLLTDGRHNTGPHPYVVLPQLEEEGIIVFTIGLGYDVDEELLKTIADETGGKYYFAPTPDKLDEIFTLVYVVGSGMMFVASFSDTISEGETQAYSLMLDPSGSYQVALKWEGSELNMSLLMWGMLITLDNASDAGIDVRTGSTFIIYEFRLRGSMLTNVTAVIVGVEGTTNYTLSVITNSTRGLYVFTDKEEYELYEPVIIKAVGPVGWSIIAFVYYPNGSLAGELELHDDGLHDDSGPDDGIYGSIAYNLTSEAGEFTIKVLASSPSGVTRIEEASFTVTNTSFTPAIYTDTPSLNITIVRTASANLTVFSDTERMVYVMIERPSNGVVLLPPDAISVHPSMLMVNSSGTTLNMSISVPAGTPPGVYKGALVLYYGSALRIPIIVNVVNATLAVTPPTVELEVTHYEPASFELTVSAVGSQADLGTVLVDIAGNITEVINEWPTSFELRAGESYLLTMAVNSSKVGRYIGIVVFSSPKTGLCFSVEVAVSIVDVLPPTIRIIAPAPNSYVRGELTILANVTDDVAVEKVEFYIDGDLAFTDTSAPWEWLLNTRDYPDGEHIITLIAYDTSGNTSNQTTSLIFDNTAPVFGELSVEPEEPAWGEEVIITINISDALSGVDKASLLYRVGGAEWRSADMKPQDGLWRGVIPGQAFGSHVEFKVRAYDAVGNTAETPVYSYTVNYLLKITMPGGPIRLSIWHITLMGITATAIIAAFVVWRRLRANRVLKNPS